MTKAELITTITNKKMALDEANGVEKSTATKKAAGEWLDVILNTITDSLVDGDPVRIVGFGTFEVKDRQARKGYNPQTGETLDIEAHKGVKFKPSKALKDAVNA